MAILRTDCFFCWLSNEGKAGYTTLAGYAEAEQWPRVHSLVHAWRLIEAIPNLTDPEKVALKEEAALAFIDFERSRSNKKTVLGLNAFGFGVFLFMAATLGILALAIFEPLFLGSTDEYVPLLTRLADVEEARGLITFVFVIGVIALALIIVTANDGEASRFERSKEILVSLIAIVGTILGFYVGKGS